jgi:hypothetical protein
LPPARTRRQGPVGRNRAAMLANRPVQDRKARSSAKAEYGCGQRALCASNSFPSSKPNPLATHAKVSIG